MNFTGTSQWPYRTTTEKINAHGWRDNLYSYEKPTDTYRIAVIGCSRTYGYGVDAEETYAKYLERMLNNDTGRKVEVMNFGVNGYGLSQMALNYIKYVRRYHPDLVIVQFYATSIGRVLFTEMWATPKPTFALENGELFIRNYPVPQNRFRSFETWLMTKSIFYRFIKNQLLKIEQIKKDRAFAQVKSNEKLHILCTAIFKLLKNVTDQNNSHLIVFSWGENAHWLLDICRGSDIEALNLDDYENIELWQQKGDLENPPPVGHWSPLGNQFVATALYNYLKAKNTGGIFR